MAGDFPTGRAGRIAPAGCVIVFVVLATLVAAHWRPLIDLDAATTARAYHAALATGWLRVTALVVTTVGSPGVVDVIAAAVALPLLLTRRWRPALAVAGARLVALGIESLVKGHDGPAEARVHPAADQRHRGEFSVRAGAATVLLVIGIAASRLLLGVHYPSDVLAGLALGFGCATAAILLTRPPAHHRADPAPAPGSDA